MYQTVFRTLSLALGLSLLAAAAGAADYKLGPQDRISVKAQQWRESLADVFEWQALKGEYTVNSSGRLSVPLIGQVQAVGMSTAELALLLGERLKANLGLAVAPNVSVEIAQYRPFYIVGDVDKPGEFSYRPGLTVLQALSIAGGLRRPRSDSETNVLRENITRRGEISLLDMDIDSLTAKRARLSSELNQENTISFPPELTRRASETGVKLLIQQENEIFKIRKESLVTQTASINELIAFLKNEVTFINAQIGSQGDQLKLVNEELRRVKGLIDKNLSPAGRKLGLQRTEAEYFSSKLRLEAERMRAQQDIGRNQLAIVELRNKRRNEVSSELRETQSKLDAALTKMATTKRLASELGYMTVTSSNKGGPADAGAGGTETVYRIVRLNEKRASVEIEADETSAVNPGDTIKVQQVASQVGN